MLIGKSAQTARISPTDTFQGTTLLWITFSLFGSCKSASFMGKVCRELFFVTVPFNLTLHDTENGIDLRLRHIRRL